MEIAYASPWKRLGALLIDTVIVILAGAILGVIIGSTAAPSAWDDPMFESRWNGIGYLLAWLYYAVMESSSSQGTLGKKWLGLHVVGLDAQPISFWRATGRFFGRIISVIPLCAGFFIAFFTQKRQTLHDMMASCIVIDERADSVPSQHIDNCRQQNATPLSHFTRTSPALAETSLSAQSMVDEDAIYASIAHELKSGTTDEGLWTRLFAECDGDENKAKAAYIKHRAEKLISIERDKIRETVMAEEHEQLKSNKSNALGVLADNEIEYLVSPILAVRYLEKYGVSKDSLAEACAMKKIKSVMHDGVLWVQDKHY